MHGLDRRFDVVRSESAGEHHPAVDAASALEPVTLDALEQMDDAIAKSALFGTFTFDPGFLGYIAYDGAANVN